MPDRDQYNERLAEALAMHRQGRLQEAAVAYADILRRNPGHFDARHFLGLAHHQVGEHQKAVALIGEALTLKRDPEALNNLGLALSSLGRQEEAVQAFDEAIALAPHSAVAFYNKGNLYRDAGRSDEALACYVSAAALDPQLAEAHWNEGTLRLHHGDFAGGWPKFEWRFKVTAHQRYAREFTAPLWTGEERLAGKTILLHAEQGLGDTIQFCRYAKLVAKRGGRVLLAAPKALKTLFSNLAGVDHFTPLEDELPPFDYYCPLMSLPYCFRTQLETIPANIPYLHADTNLQKKWCEKIGPHGFRVGIAWQGNPANPSDKGRSIPLAEYIPLANIPGVRLISLQRHHGLEQLTTLPVDVNIETLGDAFDAGPGAFVDTAAVMASMDLIITSDTAIAHLAGALGHPTWLALNAIADWRWLLERTDSPWYPTLRIFKQPVSGDWTSVFRNIADTLKEKIL